MPRIHMESLISEDETNLEYFTLYWVHGDRNVIKGQSIEDAFTRAGYGHGAVPALDWYDNGVTETHRWDKENKTWVKYNTASFMSEDFSKFTDEAKEMHLKSNLESNHSVTIIMPNKDEFTIRYNTVNFAQVGWVRYIEVAYAEYCEGSYSDDCEEDHHFMVCQTEYFDPEDPVSAINAFIKRFNNEPFSASHDGVGLNDIREKQRLL